MLTSKRLRVVAPHGEKVLTVKVRFWADDISSQRGTGEEGVLGRWSRLYCQKQIPQVSDRDGDASIQIAAPNPLDP